MDQLIDDHEISGIMDPGDEYEGDSNMGNRIDDVHVSNPLQTKTRSKDRYGGK
jgi:hypothetical protein